jgi:hypothetical protein
LGKIREAYAKKLGVSPDSIRFVFDGNVLQNDGMHSINFVTYFYYLDTPETHDMEDGDIVNAQVTQVGGMI